MSEQAYRWRITALEEQVERLTQQNKILRETIAKAHGGFNVDLVFALRQHFRLTHQQACIMQAVLENPVAYYAQVDPLTKSGSMSKEHFRLQISAIRHALEPLKIQVRIDRKVGYSISPSDKKKIYEILSGQRKHPNGSAHQTPKHSDN